MSGAREPGPGSSARPELERRLVRADPPSVRDGRTVEDRSLDQRAAAELLEDVRRRTG